MKNLEIEGKQIHIAKQPSSVEANVQTKQIKVEGLLDDIEDIDFENLQKWVEEYKQQYKDVLTIEGTKDFRFAIPKENLIYSKYYSYSENCRTEFSNILEKLSFFNLHIINGSDKFIPTFYGSMETGMVKFVGEFYTSYTDDFMVPIFAWLELFLSHTPPKIRLEFWMTYFNTSASRKLLEFMEILEHYRKKNKQTDIQVFWYYLEDDKDSLEEGQLYKDETSLPFEIVVTNEELWQKMNK